MQFFEKNKSPKIGSFMFRMDLKAIMIRMDLKDVTIVVGLKDVTISSEISCKNS